MESIISTEKVCWVCGTNRNIHCHHIFGGVSRRKLSEKRGFKVYLCSQHHGEAHKHINSGFSLYLKMECQKYYEENYGERSQFIEEFGRSVL